MLKHSNEAQSHIMKQQTFPSCFSCFYVAEKLMFPAGSKDDGNSQDMRHEKTDLKVFVVVIPKEG